MPHHVDSIGEIEYIMGYDEPPELGGKEHNQWKKLWETLASFKGLKKLSVSINVVYTCKYLWSRREQCLLQEVKLVTQPQVFVLKLNWRAGRHLLDLPCSILRTS
jgi:hypothetical protein